MNIRLITFDLDDTFWETTPAIQSAETALRDWLAAHAPRLGDFPIEALGAIRRMLVEREPALRHRISELRRRILQHALQDAGYAGDGVDHRDTGIILGHSTYLHRGQVSHIQNHIVLDQTLELLKDWLTHHILKVDKAYVAHFRAHGLG